MAVAVALCLLAGACDESDAQPSDDETVEFVGDYLGSTQSWRRREAERLED